MNRPAVRTFLLTIAALIAFAGNSLLTRLALAQAHIDAATFSTVRLVAGAVTLIAVSRLGRRDGPLVGGSWSSAFLLFIYAVPFSFAYVSLSVGTGALLLFGAVQVTMMLSAIRSGIWPHRLQWLGLSMALVGLVYLVSPGLSAPDVFGSVFMIIGGVAWGLYSVRGRSSTRPLAETTGNFTRAVPMVVIVTVASLGLFHADRTGFVLAVVSGAVTSGLGYVVWYAALAGLGAVRAAVVQVATPVIAAAGGVLVLGESVSGRLLVSGLLILGGIGIAVLRRERVT